jgi:hypothetical protein
MVSLESMERRSEDPKASCVFCQCFCKAAVGEVRWKECMDDSEERIGDDTTEAFALLLFANNCKAWLCEEKANHGEALWTECESDAGNKKDSVVDRLLCDQEFVLEEGPGELLVQDTTKHAFKKAARARKDWLRELCHLPVCGEMMRSWSQTGSVDENQPNAAEPAANDKKEQDEKRRKLMKGLKKWTGLADEGERKFKGWSDNGQKAFEEWTVVVKNDVGSGKHALWEKAFGKAHQTNQQDARRSEDEQVKKHVVSRSVVWDLQQITATMKCVI